MKTLSNDLVDIVWKDTLVNPTEDLTKISQFAGENSNATIDKVAEVKLLLRKREERVQVLEKQL